MTKTHFYFFDTILEGEYLAENLYLLSTSRAFSTPANSMQFLSRHGDLFFEKSSHTAHTEGAYEDFESRHPVNIF